MAYDKDKRAKSINKQGYAHASFRKKPSGILLIWGKYANILNMSITGFTDCDTSG